MTTARSEPTTLYWFTTKTCQPCKRMAPAMQELIDAGVPVTKIDCDEHPELVEKYGIASVPTLMLMSNAGEVKRYTGALNEFGLWRFIE